jgi:hypothetical protein
MNRQPPLRGNGYAVSRDLNPKLVSVDSLKPLGRLTRKHPAPPFVLGNRRRGGRRIKIANSADYDLTARRGAREGWAARTAIQEGWENSLLSKLKSLLDAKTVDKIPCSRE